MQDFEEDPNPFRTDVDEVPPPVPGHSDSNAVSSPVPLDDDDGFADVLATPQPPAKRALPSSPPPPVPKSEFCCTRDQFLHSEDEAEILIVDAQKSVDHSSSPFIVYVIRTENVEARRRYSEFESLRNGLSKLYPTLIVPPIPQKQSIGDYAIKQAKAKEDATMIARRKRMLQVFLNRIAKHPILSHEHVFHRFIDRDVSWTEILNTPPLSLIPKNILKAPAHNPTDPNVTAAYQSLPTPSAAQTLRRPDQRFLDSEAFTSKFANHMGGPMEKVTRRTMKRWSEFSQDHADLGAVLNGFSLSESGTLASSVEKTGQAVDATYVSTTRLLQDLEQAWTEPVSEYAQFAAIIKKLLVYRHQKHVQHEMTQDALASKKETLEELEKSEAEARRLDSALSASSSLGRAGSRRSLLSGEEPEEEGATTPTGQSGPTIPPPRPPPSPTAPSQRRRASSAGMGFLNALSYTLHGMMDVDPEASRRNSISKTRETLNQLEDGLQASAQDLKYASSTIQADLDRFQRQKVADIREMCIAMARIHREWCRKNLEAWEEAKKEIDKIEPHPNRPSPDSTSQPTSPNAAAVPVKSPVP